MALPENFLLAFLMATIAVAATILINSAVLWGILRLLKLKDNKYSKALKTAAVSGMIMFFASQVLIGLAYGTGIVRSIMLVMFAAIPAVTMMVNYYLVKLAYRHKRILLIATAWSVAGWLISNILVSVILVTLLNSVIVPTTVTANLT